MALELSQVQYSEACAAFLGQNAKDKQPIFLVWNIYS